MKTLLMLLVFGLSTTSVWSQSSTVRTVVLIDGIPYLADISTSGDILQQYQRIDDYFTTRESHNSIVSKLSERPEPTGESIVLFEKEKDPQPSFTQENKAPILTGESQYLGFSPDKAILTKSAVDQIRKIADQHPDGQIDNIFIVSYHIDSYRSRAIARNRARGIQELLVAFGAPRSQIDYEIRDASVGTKVDFVQVSFR